MAGGRANSFRPQQCPSCVCVCIKYKIPCCRTSSVCKVDTTCVFTLTPSIMSISPCLCIGAAQCIQLVQDGKYESSRQRAVICITNILPNTCSSETTTLAEMDIYICRHIHTHNMNVRWPLCANEPECWPCSTPGRRMRNVKDEESAVER